MRRGAADQGLGTVTPSSPQTSLCSPTSTDVHVGSPGLPCTPLARSPEWPSSERQEGGEPGPRGGCGSVGKMQRREGRSARAESRRPARSGADPATRQSGAFYPHDSKTNLSAPCPAPKACSPPRTCRDGADTSPFCSCPGQALLRVGEVAVTGGTPGEAGGWCWGAPGQAGTVAPAGQASPSPSPRLRRAAGLSQSEGAGTERNQCWGGGGFHWGRDTFSLKCLKSAR